MQYQRKLLPNGLRVIVAPMPSFESATVLVHVFAGSRFETKQNSGISHFLEHMAFKGTKKRPSALSISTLIDGVGGECNAFTGKETTGYYIKSKADHIGLSMDILSDMLSNSLFKEEEIEKERGVILEELNLYEDTPARKIGDVYERLLYGDSPLGWDVGGEKDVIKTIKREDFVTYLSRFYSAHSIAVVVAGGVQVEETFDLVKKHFGHMATFDTKSYTKVVDKQDKPYVLLRQKTTEQVHIALGVRTVSLMHPHRYALSILSAILGGGMSSRLFHEVREKRGLAYYVRSASEHYQDCGSLVSFAGVDPKRVEEAIAVILEQYHGISSRQRRDSISNEEIKKAKEFIKGHLVLELEDSRAVAGFYGSQELLEAKIDTLEKILDHIDGVTLDDVLSVAKTYFVNNRLNLAVIGNFSDGQRFEKLLA